jgi:threonine/homoserine/homoserine lactone efflux protein
VTLSAYLFYVAAVLLLTVTPGPTMLMTLTNSVNHGPWRALASLCGALAANFVIMALSALGLGALLATSEAAFTALKLVGAAYLIWLGVRTFRSGTRRYPGEGRDRWPLNDLGLRRGDMSLFMQGVLVAASNPKSLLFFTAFFPQFIDPAAPFVPQFALLSLTFLVIDFVLLGAGAFGVGRIAPRLRQAHVVRWINRACGGLFALLGGLLLFARRSG